MSCELLAQALEEVTGEEPLMAYTDVDCSGTPPDRSVLIRLMITEYAPAEVYPDAKRTTTIGGHPAIDLGSDEDFHGWAISPTGDLATPGLLEVAGWVETPLGDTSYTPGDPALVTLTDRVAEAVLRAHFS